MRIDGRKIAEEIRNGLRSKIQDLRSKNIVPKIAIITLGPEESWETYVRQKIKVAGELGIKAVLINPKDASEERLYKTIREIDQDSKYHGIIVQRPIPEAFNREKVVNAISPDKDIDGFRSDSRFEVPVWLAVKRLIEESFEIRNLKLEIRNLDKLSFAVLGKGETAGGPVIRGLKTMGIEPKVIDSQTQNREEILKNADVIISCVGKQNIVHAGQIKKGAMLIGVGIHGEDTDSRTKLVGDYDEKEIEEVAGAYTPTPGGIGPVNLSYLFKNLVEAASLQSPQV